MAGAGGEREGRLARSWGLTRRAWRVIRYDPVMLALAAAAAILTAAGGAAVIWLAREFGPHPSRERVLVAFAVAAWPLAFVGAFFNVALAAAAAAAFDGRRLTLREALGHARARTWQIALWSLLAAGVGVLLQEIANRLPAGGRLASWLLGAAWALVTFFAIPILAIEGCTAAACVRRSAALMRERWGEGLGGSVIITAWTVVPSVPLGAVLGVGIGLLPAAVGVVLVAIGAAGLVAMTAISGAVRQVYAVALYRYALTGNGSGAFAERDLERPFAPRRRGLFRRS
jgi:hypothetical protein